MQENCVIKMFVILLVGVFLHCSEAVVYRLNDSQYAMMPPAIYLDPYDVCQRDANSLYCTAEFVLGSDKPSPLLDMIKEYSEHQVSDYDHTKLRYGICVTQTCKPFYSRENGDLRLTLEACLNQSLSEKYDLKVNILDKYHCKSPASFTVEVDSLDIFVAILCILLLAANIGGSLSYFYLAKRKDKELEQQSKVQRLLLCFSFQRNWKKLMMPFASGEPRLQRLRCIHGIRVILTIMVIFAHAALPCLFFIHNSQYVKELFSSQPTAIFLNGSLFMQTFLIISSFLLVYHWQDYSDKYEDSWHALGKQILFRWLRLTPSYAFVLLLTATWLTRIATGPLWHEYVAVERNDCRQYWWQYILYINNYFSNSKCMIQSWYLATDFQLYILAVIVYLTCRTYHSRKIVLISLFIIGSFIPAAIIYYNDMDAITMFSPENIVSLFDYHPNFHYIYKCAHTNIPACMVGMAMGYLVYHWQTKGIRFHYQILKYRVVYWSLFPLSLLCCYSGIIFYADGPRPSIYVRALYAAVSKPLFSLIISGIIVGCIFKIEGWYRGILEWSGWKIFSRLTFSAYLLNVVLIKIYVGARNDAITVDHSFLGKICFALLTVTYVAALFLWLLIEAPFSNIIKEYLLPSTITAKKKTT